jgi:K+-transporting ATPase A subunit
MEGLALGLGGSIVKYVWENGGETVTQETIEASVRTIATKLPQASLEALTALGDRLKGRFGEGVNPFENPELLAKMVAEEATEPEVIEAVQSVTQNMPSITIENWKGINTKGSGHTISNNTLHIS